MVNVYIPQLHKRQKTLARGFWQSPEGRLYYDYIVILPVPFLDNQYISSIQKAYNQKAIFYCYNKKAYIYTNKKDIEFYAKNVSINHV